MSKNLNRVFDGIRAEEQLKQDTLRAVRAEAARRGRPVAKPYPARRLAALAASLALLIAVGGYVLRSIYYTEAAYVDLDVNPSIELALNRFGRVVGAAAYNPDGAAILQAADVEGLPYAQAVDALISEIARDGFFSRTENLVSVTVQAGDPAREAEILSTLRQTVGQSLSANSCQSAVDLFAVTGQVREQARSHGISPAKYLAILALQAVDSTATFESCHGQSISEINRRAEECRQSGQNHGAEADSDGGAGRKDDAQGGGSHGGGQNGGSHDGHG